MKWDDRGKSKAGDISFTFFSLRSGIFMILLLLIILDNCGKSKLRV